MIIHQIKLGINSCYLIKGESFILIDGGLPGKKRSFKRQIDRLGIQPTEIKLIVLTHSHFDHAGSVKEIQELTGAGILMHKVEEELSKDGKMIIPKGVNTWGKITQPIFFPIFRRITFPEFKVDIPLNEDEHSLAEYGVRGKVIHTPGHTPGSVSVVLESGDAFVGCMAHDGLPFRFRPGLPIYACDTAQLKESWKKLINQKVKIIYPGHGNPFPVEHILKYIS